MSESAAEYLAAGLAYDSEKLDKALLYMRMLLKKNEVMNLTAIVDEHEFIERNIIDPLFLIPYLPPTGKVIDVGTGAGLPGMMLKIFEPGIELTLLDSVRKKLDFIREAADVLAMNDIEYIHMRAEDAGRDIAHREKYDICVARAVAPLGLLCEYCLPLVKKGGRFIAMKGRNAGDELEFSGEIYKRIGADGFHVDDYELPYSHINMKLIIFDKTRVSPSGFPRSAKDLKKIYAK